MKIGVTGGNGFLGKYVVDALQNKGYEAIAISRSNYGNNITTNYSVEDLTTKLNHVDGLIHLAGVRNPSPWYSDYNEITKVTQNLFEACKINGINNVVFASSISVYDDQELLPWSEKQIPSPVSMYGINKYTCELIGNRYAKLYGIKVKNLRFAHLFGFNEKNNYMINLFMRKAFNSSQISVDIPNNSKREFLYAKDAAEATISALEYSESGTFNIGNKNCILTNEEVADKINTVFFNETDVKKNIKDNQVLKSSFMTDIESNNNLNFHPEYTFEEALGEIYEQMKGLGHVPELY